MSISVHKKSSAGKAYVRRLVSVAWYYQYKLVHRLASLVVVTKAESVYKPGITYGSFVPPAAFSGTIVFAFWDRALVHLGDQLFNQPCMEALRVGHRVIVCAHPSFDQYFASLGYETMPLEALRALQLEGALFVSKDDMLFSIRRAVSPKNFFLAIDYGAIDGTERITAAILRITTEMIQYITAGAPAAVLSPQAAVPRTPDRLVVQYAENPALRTLAADGRKFIVFNAYVASNFLDARRSLHVLLDMARAKRAEGYAIVHVGSAADKELDHRVYDFVDFDLRGELNIYELFALFALANVEGVISFDTFIMHVASVMQKNMWVAIKYRAGRDVFAQRFVPMYPGGEELVKSCY